MPPVTSMHLKVQMPSETLVDQEVHKIVAEAENGYFCLLPRHVDFVAALVPGLLTFVPSGGKEEYLAIDEGVLVKVGNEVLISSRNAVRGADLASLKEAVQKQFLMLTEREKAARSALNRIEAMSVRKFLKLSRPYG